MTKTTVLSVIAVLISAFTFAQKDQVKAAEKALKAGNPGVAVSLLEAASSSAASLDSADKAKYNFVKGNAYFELANKNIDSPKNLLLAASAFKELKEIERKAGDDKYTNQANESISQIKNSLLNSAIDDTKQNRNQEGAQKLYDLYLLDKKDTLNLYYAAATYSAAKDYSSALKMYSELKDLNYSGQATNYLAKNKISGEEDLYKVAKDRDLAVKLGSHESPRNENILSKRGEIYKSYALILLEQGKVDEAKKAISDAKKLNPDDYSLALAEANLYLEIKDFDTYKKLISEIVQKNPNNADLQYNLGALSYQAKNLAEAEQFFNKTIEIDPKYTNAYINLASIKLADEKKIVDEMNKLGTTDADNKKYDVLKAKRVALYKSSIPFLEKAVELDPKNLQAATTLLKVYNAIELTDKAAALKKIVKDLEDGK